MRILILNQCFYPDVAATAQHAWDLACKMRDQGNEVTAIASRSLYGAPGEALPQCEDIEGISIKRVGSSRYGKASLAARAFDFLNFYLFAAWEALRLPRQDVVVCLTTPPFLPMLGLLLRVLRGTKCVYWCMDMYPDVLMACGVISKRSMVGRLLEGLNRVCLRRSDHVVVLGRCMEKLAKSKGALQSHLSVIRPWGEPGSNPRPRCADNRYRSEWGARNRTVVMYSGNFGLGHDFEAIIKGIIALRNDQRFLFALVGGGKRKSEVTEALRAANVENYVDLPYQPRERLGELLAAGDIHIVSMIRAMNGIMVPSKFFGIAAAGRAVIYVGPSESEVAKCIEEAKCGVVIDSTTPHAFEHLLLELVGDDSRVNALGNAALSASKYSWSSDANLNTWTQLLARLLLRK